MNPYSQIIEDVQIIDESSVKASQGKAESSGKKVILDNLKLNERIRNIYEKKYSTDTFSLLRNNVRGMVIGGIIGLGAGMYFKKNLYFTALMGGIAGGIFNHFINKINLE